MGFFYLDDSVHTAAGFIIIACVYSNEDLTGIIESTFKEVGIDDPLFEFKSSATYLGNHPLQTLRQKLKELLNDQCKFGLVILPSKDRHRVGIEGLKGVKQFIEANQLVNEVNVFIDQGMFIMNVETVEKIENLKRANMVLQLEQDSKKIKGIQMADLVAHTASIRLKSTMGLIQKIVRVEGDPIYEEVDLDFELFATLRSCFFRDPAKSIGQNDFVGRSTFRVEPFGLYISEYCNEELADYARAIFGTTFLGCIH